MNRMGACFDRLRYEVFQNLILSPMNTGFLGPAVATVLTVYGIETSSPNKSINNAVNALQQFLPFTVLKLQIIMLCSFIILMVATVLTVYGIETLFPLEPSQWNYQLQQFLPFTVLKRKCSLMMSENSKVATVLTVYGIETDSRKPQLFPLQLLSCNSSYRLRYWNTTSSVIICGIWRSVSTKEQRDYADIAFLA